MSESTDNETTSSAYGSHANSNRSGLNSGGTKLIDSGNNSNFNSPSCQC